jgi:hypothetical protein
MRLTIHTNVEKSFEEVFAGFDFELFKKLTPVNPPVTIQRFDGCATGDEVHIEMTVPIPEAQRTLDKSHCALRQSARTRHLLRRILFH